MLIFYCSVTEKISIRLFCFSSLRDYHLTRPALFQHLLITGTALALLASGQGAVAADMTSADAAKAPADKWVISVGGSVEYGPNHPGSRHSSVTAFPSFDVRRFSEPPENGAPDDGFDYDLIEANGFQIGPVVNLRDNRSSKASNGFQGIHEVKTSLDAGVFLQYWAIPNQLRFRTEAREALSNGSGLVVDVGSDWFQPVGDRWILSAGPRASFGSAAYMHRYFSISDSEAAANGTVSAFHAGQGLKSVGAMVSASFAVTPDISVTLYDRFDRLVGDAASSPVTAKLGKANQNIVGLSLVKSFSVSF